MMTTATATATAEEEEDDGILFLLAERRIIGMKLSDLMTAKEEKEGEEVEVESLSCSSPSVFSTLLPDLQSCYQRWHPFVFDSEMYVARGGLTEGFQLDYYRDRRTRSRMPDVSIINDDGDDDIPCCKFYKFNQENKSFTVAADSCPPRPPTPFAPRFLGNIPPGSDDRAFYLSYYGSTNGTKFGGFWVLDGGGEWKLLPPPPPLDLCLFYLDSWVFHDKLFLLAFYRNETCYFYFDSDRGGWMPVDDYILDSYSLGGVPTGDGHCFPCTSMSLTSLTSNYSVGLWCSCAVDIGHLVTNARIHALLLSNEDGNALLYQFNDDCGIRNTPFILESCCTDLVDLGNDILCALIYGYTTRRDAPLLLISVFTLKALPAAGAGIIDPKAPRKDQEFLTFSLVAKRVFTMAEYEDGIESFLQAFVFRPKKKNKELQQQQQQH